MQYSGSRGSRDSNFVREYLKDLREVWGSTDASLTRTTFIIVVLAGTFVLIAGKGIGDVSVSGLKITNLPLVQAVIPVVVAYLAFVQSISAAVAGRLMNVHDRLCEHYWPKFHEEGLDRTLRPGNSFASTAVLSCSIANQTWKKPFKFLPAVRFVVYLVAPPLFVLYSLVQLWQAQQHPGVSTLVIVAVTVGSALLLLASIPNLVLIYALWQAGEDI